MDHDCYLAGPISSLSLDESFDRFARAENALRNEGWEPYNPRDHALSRVCHLEAARLAAAGERYQDGEIYRQLMREFYIAILGSRRVWLLPDWQEARGARAEAFLAWTAGVEVWTYHEKPARRGRYTDMDWVVRLGAGTRDFGEERAA